MWNNAANMLKEVSTLLSYKQWPTSVDDSAGEADVAADGSLEGLGPGQDPHLPLLAPDTRHCNSYIIMENANFMFI